jgi:hypothetical protein
MAEVAFSAILSGENAGPILDIKGRQRGYPLVLGVARNRRLLDSSPTQELHAAVVSYEC